MSTRLATKRETLIRAVQVLANMTGKDLTVQYVADQGYQITNKTGTYAPFGPQWMEARHLLERVTFAVDALRMAQNTAQEFTVVLVKDEQMDVQGRYLYRGHIPHDAAQDRALSSEIAAMTTADFGPSDAKAFLEEAIAEYEIEHLTVSKDA